ncbi:hypothetical protein SP19_56 [Salmonella phage 19]|nr:hypothetical protein SP19_56 [Salmonella phage 19]
MTGDCELSVTFCKGTTKQGRLTIEDMQHRQHQQYRHPYPNSGDWQRYCGGQRQYGADASDDQYGRRIIAIYVMLNMRRVRQDKVNTLL